MQEKRIIRADEIEESRRRAESNWRTYLMLSLESADFKIDSYLAETYMVEACPGELIKCPNDREVIKKRLIKFNFDESGYAKRVGKTHIPCPPLAYDSSKEKEFLLDVSKYPSLCGIKPAFLLHKFEAVISPERQADLLRRWTDFKATMPKAHNTKAGSSSRSTSSGSYHLGIWRRRSGQPSLTNDTKCGGCIIQQKKCMDFLRLVKDLIAIKIRDFLQKYAPEEWATRER